MRPVRPPTTLTARLVLTTALLAVLATTLVGVLTTLAVRQYLTDQLDRDVATSLERVRRIPPAAVLDPGGPSSPGAPGTPSPQDADGDGRRGDRIGPGDAVGSLTALRVPGVGWQGFATLQGSDGTAVRRSLDASALALLADVPADGRAHRVRLPGLGGYVVAVTRDGAAAAGLPTADVDDVVAGVVRAVVVLGLVAALASAAAAATLVRRQLRPLREVARTAHAVAALPLADGEIALDERVPARLADERSEVGQVGAALNTLLDHVAGSLEARHRSEQQVRQFVADASHELRTPLATIAGYTELARRRPDDAAMAGVALGKVEEEAGRMTALVEDLLLLARLDAGRPLEREAVDLTRLCVEAVADARVLAPGHRWRLDLPGAADGSPDGHEPVTVVGDPLRLHQVLTNLLTNARKYTPEGSTITVRVRPGGLTVHDDGPGFPPDLVEHAFERFARGDVARTRQGGVGLGLALVQAIVASHGGTVALRSAPGDTAIEVRLPQA